MTTPTSSASPSASPSPSPPSSQGNLLGLLTAAFYILFTLLPDSSSQMVAWPWVLFWQVGLLCPVLWLLVLLGQGQTVRLGTLDWFVGVLGVGVLFSSWVAEFPMQARWYSWAALCFLAALYAVHSWLSTAARRLWLLRLQGGLSLAFMVVSLGLWGSQTFWPELARVQELNQYGVNLSFDFSKIALRNWAPIGHQNYVAGYLVLALPLLVGLGLTSRGKGRSLWWVGAALGVVDLYTTSSRGGWLGLLVAVLLAFGVLLWRSRWSKVWVGVGGLGGLGLLVGLMLLNNRLRSLVFGLLSGQVSGESTYRLITMATGWQTGFSHLWTGIGPGGVLLQYQKFRPVWAGREAEQAYQLHSTPMHLWAELGIWALVAGIGAIALLIFLSIRAFRSSHSEPGPILNTCLCISLLAYGSVSLFDYQLDNIAISGLLVVYWAVLVAEASPASRAGAVSWPPIVLKILPWVGLGILIVEILWLVPIHRAWMLSSQGFAALAKQEIAPFLGQLEQAHQLAPWEPYYSNQLGWNLGNLDTKSIPRHLKGLKTEGRFWFQQAIQASPYQEFSHTNLAWLLQAQNPKAAMAEFAQSAQLIPAKRGVFYGLGLSLLAQGKPDLAVEAIALEGVRDTALITSPIWALPGLKPLYPAIAKRMETTYTQLLRTAGKRETLISQLHQSRGALRWWMGNLAAAHEDWAFSDVPLSQVVLDLTERNSVDLSKKNLPRSSAERAIAAWLNPSQRESLLRQAWIVEYRETPPDHILQQLVSSMNQARQFDQWLKQLAPHYAHRRERTGFGVNSRHIDGPAPQDFLTVVDNIPITQFFYDLVPSYIYAPDLDRALQPSRAALLQTVQKLAQG